jgi:leucine dehydrogenase
VLQRPSTVDLLHQWGILWAPDYVVSAGGVIHATALDLVRERLRQVVAA